MHLHLAVGFNPAFTWRGADAGSSASSGNCSRLFYRPASRQQRHRPRAVLQYYIRHKRRPGSGARDWRLPVPGPIMVVYSFFLKESDR